MTMSDLISRMRRRSISWERADYGQLQDYWMEAVKDGHKAAVEIERLQAALQEIASQGRPIEYDEEQRDSADYETGYDMCILTARQALQETE